MTSRVGQQLGNYRLVHLLGQGGFAEVYLAEHIYLKTQVAVKVLHTYLAQEEFPGFLQEAQTIARLKHSHIIPVFDFGIDSIPFLVMDYLPQGSLRQRHPRGSNIALSIVVSYVNQIAAALQYAHDMRVIHRDVKPENMLVNSTNEVVMSDFGIAAAAHQTATLKTVNASGSPVYMAPEHIAGKPRPASDQYSLGIVVYEWLCGLPPFQGEPMAIMYQQTYTPIPPLSEQAKKSVNNRVEQILLQALAKDPQDRFTNIMAFADALDLENFVTEVERQLMQQFIVGMRERTFSLAQAKQCARDFLAFLPFKSKGDVLEKLKKLGQTYRPAEQTYLDASMGIDELMKRIIELKEKNEKLKNKNA